MTKKWLMHFKRMLFWHIYGEQRVIERYFVWNMSNIPYASITQYENYRKYISLVLNRKKNKWKKSQLIRQKIYKGTKIWRRVSLVCWLPYTCNFSPIILCLITHVDSNAICKRSANIRERQHAYLFAFLVEVPCLIIGAAIN